MKNKKIILPFIIIFILIIIIGATYAVYTYTNISSNKELLAGNIYLNYTGLTGINIQDAMPGSPYSDYYEFTITGSNNYTKDIYYDVILLKGDLPTGKTESNRISDEYLKFKLVEVVNSVETTLLTDISYSDITNKKLYVSTVPANTVNYSKTYRLYMTISDEIILGNVEDAIYSTEEWSNIFASVKVKVTGDFTLKEADKMPTLAIDLVNDVLVTYSVASSDDFSGGLVAINTDGTLYNETSSSEEIREYRYSGTSVNNYVFLDTDGDGVKDDNEIWRIVGIFKNSSNEWNLKLMRNSVLTTSEIPETYTYNGTTFDIKVRAKYNYTYKTGTNENDWATAGLQYFLNASDGYFGTFSSNIQNIVDINYTYYLGNVTNQYDSSFNDTTIQSYTAERMVNNVISGNQGSWQGAISLLYPSDYGYSANSTYWSNTTLFNYSNLANQTSWMQKTANHYYEEWLLSPPDDNYETGNVWWSDGHVYIGEQGSVTADDDDASHETDTGTVRPCLNLLSTVEIDINHLGDLNDPYLLT